MSQEWFAIFEEGPVRVMALTVPPHVDSADVDKLHELVLAALTPHATGRWVIDLASMSYMGSSLLGLMVNIRQRIRQNGGKLVICGLNPKLMQVFRTCSLERLFTIRGNREEAVVEVSW